MTITEAIETLRANYPDACFEQLREAVDMAINALTKEAWKEEHPVSPLLQKLATNLQHSKQDDLIASAQPVDKDIYVPINDTISRQAAIDDFTKWQYQLADCFGEDYSGVSIVKSAIKSLEGYPSAQPEIILCKDCVFGHIYFDVHNDTHTESWVECINPDGLNRDVSCEGYCSAAIRRKADE